MKNNKQTTEKCTVGNIEYDNLINLIENLIDEHIKTPLSDDSIKLLTDLDNQQIENTDNVANLHVFSINADNIITGAVILIFTEILPEGILPYKLLFVDDYGYSTTIPTKQLNNKLTKLLSYFTYGNSLITTT